ncbi:MAG TPA: patatin-like phospholipase family protein [Conexibacter sp.]|nr:patatin-like phospholipase family protein [Conexibacter sp.]
MQRPDVLVLGAGGTIGAAWMSGVLAGIAAETGIDFGQTEQLVGTSAGSMVAADLLAGVEPRVPEGAADATPLEPEPDGDGENGGLKGGAARLGALLGSAAAAPLVPLALAAANPISTRLRAAALGRIASPDAALDDLRERIAGHGLRFDGRLRVVCVERESGRRVVFGAPGSPKASVAEAVQASCSVPWTHHAVRIGEHEYVDGAVWSPTNVDAAPALRDTHVLCLAPIAGSLDGNPRHAAIRAATTTALTLETLALRHRGAVLEVIAPHDGEPGEHARLTGYRQGLAFARGR